MILNKKESTVAYRCPACGSGIMSLVGVFALSGDMLRLKCSCGGSEMTMVYTPDRKLRLNVPCLVCNKPHNFLVGSNTFFSGEGEVFRLPCTYTGIDLCFIGKQNKVQEALQRANEELMKMMEDAGLQDLNDLHQNDDEMHPIDPELEDAVRYMLSELKEEDKITCRCQKKNLSSYDFSLQDGYVRIYCAGCGGLCDLPLTGAGAADDFIRNCDGLTLE